MSWIKINSLKDLPPFNKKVFIYYYPMHPVMEGRLQGIDYRREFKHLDDSIKSRLEDNYGFSKGLPTHWRELYDPPTD